MLDEVSKNADVNYYRCEACGHVWTTDRKTGEILKHVTPLTRVEPGHRSVSRRIFAHSCGAFAGQCFERPPYKAVEFT